MNAAHESGVPVLADARQLLSELVARASKHDPCKGDSNAGKWVTLNAPRELLDRCHTFLAAGARVLGEPQPDGFTVAGLMALVDAGAERQRIKEYAQGLVFQFADWGLPAGAQEIGINGLTEAETSATASVFGLSAVTSENEVRAQVKQEGCSSPSLDRPQSLSSAIGTDGVLVLPEAQHLLDRYGNAERAHASAVYANAPTEVIAARQREVFATHAAVLAAFGVPVRDSQSFCKADPDEGAAS